MIRAKFDDGSYNNLTYLQRVTKKDHEKLLNLFLIEVESRIDNYNDCVVEELIFCYHFFNWQISKQLVPVITPKNRRAPKQRLGGINLPVTTNYSEWGDVLSETETELVVNRGSTRLVKYVITKGVEQNEIVAYYGSSELYRFIDILGANPISFTRKMKGHTHIYVDGHIFIHKIDKKVSFMHNIKTHKYRTNKIITLDIETTTRNGVLIPYCICYTDGIKPKSFYLTDFKNVSDMISTCIMSLLIRKYDGYKVYVHNLSNFDGIFLFREIADIKDYTLKPLLKDGKMINLNISKNVKAQKYQIDFRDSMLMLPQSLRKLAKALNVESQKGVFPYDFVGTDNIEYVGEVPEFKYFKDISLDEYNEYCKDFKGDWNLREETIKYCELDCTTLHQIMVKFNNLIYKKFLLNIHKYPTLSSLAFNIYKTHFMKNEIIPRISGGIYNFIKPVDQRIKILCVMGVVCKYIKV